MKDTIRSDDHQSANNTYNHKRVIPLVLLFCAIFIIVFPLLMDYLIIGNSVYSNISNSDWVGFLSGYISAIIGILISMVSIVLTIRFTKDENDKERDLQKLFEQRSQDKELHLMVSDLIYSVSTCGEAILIDAEDPNNIAAKKCPNFEAANFELLKNSRKLLAYAAMRATATRRPYLNFSSTFSSIASYSTQLIDICEQFFANIEKCHNTENLRILKDSYAHILDDASIVVPLSRPESKKTS